MKISQIFSSINGRWFTIFVIRNETGVDRVKQRQYLRQSVGRALSLPEYLKCELRDRALERIHKLTLFSPAYPFT